MNRRYKNNFSIHAPAYLLNIFDKTEEGKKYNFYQLSKICGNRMWLYRNQWILEELVKNKAIKKIENSTYLILDKSKMFDVFKKILIRFGKSYKGMEFFLKSGVIVTKEGVIIDL